MTLTPTTASYSVGKGEFYTVEAFWVEYNKEEGYFEETDDERVEILEDYYVEEINGAMGDYVENLVKEVKEGGFTVPDGKFVKIYFYGRRHCDFTYNHEESYYEEVEYGDTCMAQEEFIYDGNSVFIESFYNPQ